MDNEAREGASSSRSVSHIVRIEAGAAERCTVHLDDGSSFLVDPGYLEQCDFSPGSVVDEDDIVEFTRATERFEAIDKAVDLIALRDHSVARLRLKLVQRGYTGDAIEAACRHCLNRGYLDDLRFARSRVEQRTRRRHEGSVRLLAGLANAGIAREVALDAMGSVLPDSYEEDAFRLAAAECDTRNPAGAARRLSALGFSSERVRRYLERRN